MNRRITACLAAMVCALALVGCSKSVKGSAASHSTAASSHSTGRTSSTEDTSESSDTADSTDSSASDSGSDSAPDVHHVKPTAESDALEAKLIPSIPGFDLQPYSVGDTGPSDLDKAVDDDGEPDAREVLEKDGFVVGFQNLFMPASQGAQVILFVYQFRSAEGAQAYTDRTAKGLAQADGDVTPRPLTVNGVPGAVGFEETSEGRHTRLAVFVRGPYAAEVVVGGPVGDTALPDLDAVAQEQYQRLG